MEPRKPWEMVNHIKPKPKPKPKPKNTVVGAAREPGAVEQRQVADHVGVAWSPDSDTTTPIGSRISTAHRAA